MKIPIEYDRATLKAQCPDIMSSVLSAVDDSCRKVYSRIFPFLKENDPPELWNYALPHLESDSKVPVYQEWRKTLIRPTFEKTIEALLARKETKPVLRAYLEKALSIDKRGIVTLSDSEMRTKDRTEQLLIQHWIGFKWTPELKKFTCDPSSPRFLRENLCFYSDRAMAKRLYYLQHKRELAHQDVDTETERVRKKYKRLGLIPSRLRFVRDIKFRRINGQDSFEFFIVEKRSPKSSKTGQI